MTTGIVVDSTLIASIIGAAAAIITASATSIWNTVSTRKVERSKLIESKKEELLRALIDLQNAVFKYNLFVIFENKKIIGGYDLKKLEAIDEIKDLSLAKIELIGQAYFKEKGIEKIVTSFFDYEMKYISRIRTRLVYSSEYNETESMKSKATNSTDYASFLNEITELKMKILKEQDI